MCCDSNGSLIFRALFWSSWFIGAEGFSLVPAGAALGGEEVSPGQSAGTPVGCRDIQAFPLLVFSGCPGVSALVSLDREEEHHPIGTKLS